MGKSVLSACLESGFSDYSSFVKTFRKLYGITPAEYREQLRSALNRVPAESAAV
jgi:AraC-like DNA-binding protein